MTSLVVPSSFWTRIVARSATDRQPDWYRSPCRPQGGYRDLAVWVVVTGKSQAVTNVVFGIPVVTVFSADPAPIIPSRMWRHLPWTGGDGEIETRLMLILDPGVTAVGDQSVLVQAAISAIQSSITLVEQQVEVVGLAPVWRRRFHH
jgi:hypothetical protein